MGLYSELLIGVALFSVTSYIWYKTIFQGYRTGVLSVRGGRIDRRVSPRLFYIVIVVFTVLILEILGGLLLLIYGETHPDWRRIPAKHALQSPPGFNSSQ
jgi:hypothetical protein